MGIALFEVAVVPSLSLQSCGPSCLDKKVGKWRMQTYMCKLSGNSNGRRRPGAALRSFAHTYLPSASDGLHMGEPRNSFTGVTTFGVVIIY